MTIKLVISDLDDTLLKKDKSISEETLKTLKNLKDLNIYFGVATGRSLFSVSKTLKNIGLFELCDVLITMNGAQKKDLILNQTEAYYYLDKSEICEIYKRFASLGLNYCIYDSTYVYALREDDSVRRIALNHNISPVLLNVDDLPNLKFPKLIFIVPEGKTDVVNDFYKLNKMEKYTGFFSRADLFEVIDNRVSKSYAIAKFCQDHGFSEANVMAFGDHNNDVDMLKNAKIGICVANGTAEAKSAATELTSSCDEDGVSHYLKKYFELT